MFLTIPLTSKIFQYFSFCSSKSTNTNREYLINFAKNDNLKISNSFFRKKNGGNGLGWPPTVRPEIRLTTFLYDMRPVKNTDFSSDDKMTHLQLAIRKREKFHDFRKTRKPRLLGLEIPEGKGV